MGSSHLSADPQGYLPTFHQDTGRRVGQGPGKPEQGPVGVSWRQEKAGVTGLVRSRGSAGGGS